VDTPELLSRVALSFGIGLLMGLERGWHTREARPGSRTAGVRTFTITGLAGGILGALANAPDGPLSSAGGILLGCGLLAYAAVITLFCREENRATGTFSATTAIAGVLTFLLGSYALLGDVRVAAAAAVAAAGILIVREELHDWVAKISLRELESGLILLAMTFIALPMLPDRALGPFGGVNIRTVWVIAIILALVSFAGYVAVKLLGERRGAIVAGAAGGLISSTAVMLANARRASEAPAGILAASAVLANGISFLRVAVLVTALAPTLTRLAGPPLLIGALVSIGSAFIAAKLGPTVPPAETPEIRFRNPFGFWYVLSVAASMGALILVGRLLYEWFGARGVISGATAMGLFDVDAMTVSITRLPLSLDQRVAAGAILAGVASNTLAKVVIAAVIAPKAFTVRVTAASLASLIASGMVLAAVLAWIAV
jgi:uncharacterized membrane protein (DUF4010 family)